MKIGEATYSDVYLIDDEKLPQAVKVIPLGNIDQLSIIDAFSEINSTRSVSRIQLNPKKGISSPHYIKLYSAGLCVGKYDKKLLELWDAYDQENASENIRPCIYLQLIFA